MIAFAALAILFGIGGYFFVLIACWFSHPIHEPSDYLAAAIFGVLAAASHFTCSLWRFL